MPRARRPYHHGDLRKSLVGEAAKLVETDGVAALTLRELSRRLGVSHAAPTNHFADKDALLAELAAEGFEELAAALTAAQGRTPEARLRELGRAYVRFARSRPGHYRVMFGRGFSSQVPNARLAEAGLRAFVLLEQAVVEAMPAERARSAKRVREGSFLAWSVVHGAAMLILDGPMTPHLVPVEDDEGAIAQLVEHVTGVVAGAVAGGG